MMVARPPDTTGKTGSEDLARVILLRREQLGMSRQELADAARIPYPTIAQIETAYRGVSPGRLGVIARVLGLDPKELYDLLAGSDDDGAPAESVVVESAAAPAPAPAARGGSWHPNRRFAAVRTPPEPAAGPSSVVVDEVVDEVLAVLRQVPADERIAVLGQVQTRVLEGLVAERLAERSDPGPPS